jgi:hypothetical protein
MAITPGRAAVAALAATLVATAGGWAIMWITRPEDLPVTEIIPPTLLTGIPLGLAAAALAHRALTELACIESRSERAKFAYNCALEWFGRGLGAKTWTTAALVGVLVAAGTFLASRESLAGDRAGIGVHTMFGPAVLLFVVAAGYTLAMKSFGAGLQTSLLSLVAALAGYLAVGMAESWRWYHSAGVYLLDGETIKESTALGAALDFVNPFFVFLHLAFWLPAAVLGATISAWLRDDGRYRFAVTRP